MFCTCARTFLCEAACMRLHEQSAGCKRAGVGTANTWCAYIYEFRERVGNREALTGLAQSRMTVSFGSPGQSPMVELSGIKDVSRL